MTAQKLTAEPEKLTTSTIEPIDPAKPFEIISTPETAMKLFDSVTMELGIAKIQEFKELTLEKNGFEKVKACRILAKKARCAVVNRQKELTDGAKVYSKNVDFAAKRIIGLIEPIEQYLEGEEEKHKKVLEEEKKREEARKAAVLQDRCDRLAKVGSPAGNLIALGNMSDELFEIHLKERGEAVERERVKAEEAAQAAAEQARKDKAEREAAEAEEKAEEERRRQFQLTRPQVVQKVEPLIPLEPNVFPMPAPLAGAPSPFRPTSVYEPEPAAPVAPAEPTFIPDISIRLMQAEKIARANGRIPVAELFRDSLAEIVNMRRAAAKVVEAMNHQGEDGWDLLKQAVAELSGFVE